MPSESKAKTKLARSEVILTTLIIITSLIVFIYATAVPGQTVFIDGQEFNVEVADVASERSQGLSGRSALANDEGMLFVFPESGRFGFWMKDMEFSIDIIWIDEDKRIVHIEENVSPSTYPEAFYSSTNARYVLEVYTGQAAAQGLGLGDEVVIDI